MKNKILISLFFLGASCYALGAPTAHAVRLYLYPENIEVIAGGSFIVEVRLDTEGQSVNAVDITGSVDGGLIEDVITANSIIDIMIDAGALDSDTFHFVGGTPGGFVGDGIIGRVSMTAIRPGSLAIIFDEKTQILSEEGKSLESQTTLRGANINVIEPSANHIIITSKTHPDQNIWYSKKDLHLNWDLESGVEYSYLVSFDQMAIPDDTPDKPEGTLIWMGDINVENLNDGIYYFTLKRIGKEGIARFRAMIDTTPPDWIGLEISDGVPETSYKKFVTFLAKDTLSGINHYEVQVDNNSSELIIPPYILPDEYIRIKVKAIDNAGNVAEEAIIGDVGRDIRVIYFVVALILIGVAVVGIRPIRERIFTQRN